MINTLRDVGVEKDAHLLVHSSLRAVGEIDGGADALLDALLNVVGKDGTLVMPSFCYSWDIPKPYYDARNTPGKTGMLTEIFRSRPDTERSLNPTHSVLASGKRAGEFLLNHLEKEALGIDSPIDRVAQAGGYVLLIGVTQIANSTIHVGEAYAGVKKFHSSDGALPIAKVLMPNGTIVEHQLDCSSSCSRAFNAVEYNLRKQGMIIDITIGNAWSYLMKGLDVINTVVKMIDACPNILFCTNPKCRRCRLGREYIIKGGNPLLKVI